ncbi:cartilage acidic protein 1-like [Mya arenaria]|uniref:cartilage acidic protein 1-like n=1 Tax=Mya arenaria TaxID=6604 RepID=UPI0022E7A21C|nr:cartilage acidic protein 1-like [Mya arenaria]
MYVSSIENQKNFLSLLDAHFTTTAQTGAVAVTDIDQDGAFDVIVAVSDAANLILGYDEGSGGHAELPLPADFREALEDKQGRTVGVCACDVDGDGLDDVYLMNDNPVYPASDVIIIPDRLLSLHGAGGVRDLFSLPGNAEIAPARGGNAVGCIDSDGDGRYEILLATYSKDGRGIIQRIHVDSVDIVKVENLEAISVDSNQYLPQRGMVDRDADSYGAFMGDLDSDGDLDLMYVNWLGQARLFMGFNHTGFTQHPILQPGAGTASMVLLFGYFDTTGHPSILVTDVAAPDNYRPGNQIFHVSVQGNSTLLDNYNLGELLGSLFMNGI